MYCGLGPQTAANGNIAFTAGTMAAGVEEGATVEGLWNGLPGQLELRVRLGDLFDGPLSGTLTPSLARPFLLRTIPSLSRVGIKRRTIPSLN